MIRIVLADDHALVRKAIALLLSDQPDCEVVGEAASAAEFLALLPDAHPDVVVLDVSMPGPGIVPLLQQLSADYPGVPVLVLSMFAEGVYAKRALAAGAAGYLTKSHPPELLLDAIRKVARGGRYVSPELAEQLARDLSGSAPTAPHVLLSDRELDVLRLIGVGKSVKQIGAMLQISPKTVTTYRARVLEKLAVQTNADLVRYVLANGLTEA